MNYLSSHFCISEIFADIQMSRSAGGFSEKQKRITKLSDPALNIAGKPFLSAYAQGVNNTDWGMRHIWKGAPYENTTVDDVSTQTEDQFLSLIIAALDCWLSMLIRKDCLRLRHHRSYLRDLQR